MERAEAGVFAALAGELHGSADDVGQRDPGADFVEELGRECHQALPLDNRYAESPDFSASLYYRLCVSPPDGI